MIDVVLETFWWIPSNINDISKQAHCIENYKQTENEKKCTWWLKWHWFAVLLGKYIIALLFSSGCDGAPLLPLLYVISNILFNISILNLLKVSNAIVASLAARSSGSSLSLTHTHSAQMKGTFIKHTDKW